MERKAPMQLRQFGDMHGAQIDREDNNIDMKSNHISRSQERKAHEGENRRD